MRADRLLSLLMLLHTRGQLTAERLSRELEVSIRTVYRDIYALRVAGFPVYSERGAGGGCYLHEDYRMRLTDLTQDELTALFTMAVPTPLIDLGVGQDAKGALLKLAAALPSARKNVESFVRNRIQLDPQSWRPSLSPIPTLSLIREGVWSDRWMRVTFLRMQRIRTSQDIAPLALVAKEKRWYVIWVGRDDEIHVDRASAIDEAELTEEQFERPETFDLPSYWDNWAKRHVANLPSFMVIARVESILIPSLITELGSECVHRSEESESKTLVHLRFEYFQQARSVVLRFGSAVEVIKPEALRRSIADFADQIVSVYAADS